MPGILEYIASNFGRPSITSDSGGFAAGQPSPADSAQSADAFAPPPNQGLPDYPASREQGGFREMMGGSPGQTLKSFLPGAIVSAVLGSLGGLHKGNTDGPSNWGEALASFTDSYLQTKLGTALGKRKQKQGQEDFLIQKAYEIKPESLVRAGAPPEVQSRVDELIRKRNEALQNDGVISAGEARELLALAAPLQVAAAKLDVKAKDPMEMARQKELGNFAGILQQEELRNARPDVPLSQAGEGDRLPLGEGPEAAEVQANRQAGVLQDAARAYSDQVEGSRLVQTYDPSTGRMIFVKPTEALRAGQKQQELEFKDRTLELRALDSLRRAARQGQALDLRQSARLDAALRAAFNRHKSVALANAYMKGETFDEAALASQIEQAVQSDMEAGTAEFSALGAPRSPSGRPRIRGSASVGAGAIGAPPPAQAGPKVGDVKTFPNGRKGRWDGRGWVAIQ